MIAQYRCHCSTVLLLAVSVVATFASSRSGEELFNRASVPSLELHLDEKALQSLNESNRTYVKGTFRTDNQVFRDVGVRLKGRSTYQPLDRKPSFTVKFNQFADQKFFGLTKIMLNNAAADPSFLREYLANQLFRDAGVPAPRVTHARVKLNGRDLGLYVVVEGITKRFLREHFSQDSGNLYEGGFRDIDQRLEQDNGSDETQADLRALWMATQEQDPDQRWARLSKTLDTQRFITFIAMEHLTGQRDGYDVQANNYRIYHDPVSGHMVVMPHGLDKTFYDPMFSRALSPEKVLTKAVLRTHQGRAIYFRTLHHLSTNLLTASSLTNRTRAAAERIAAAAGDLKSKVQSNYLDLYDIIVHRSSNITERLRSQGLQPVHFSNDGLAALSGWKSWSTPPMETSEEMIEGKRVLRIHSPQALESAGFRTRVLLEPGKYTFKAEIRASGIEILNRSHLAPRAAFHRDRPAAGAILGTVGKGRRDFFTDTHGWIEMARDFEVDYGPEEIDLTVELHFCKGEILMRMDSAKLVRR